MIRTFRSRERGMSAIPFVVSLFLVVGFAVAWYNADQSFEDLKAKAAANARAAQENLDKQQAEAVAARAVAEVVGWVGADGKVDIEQVKGAMAGALDKWREKFTIEFTADKFQPTGSGGQIEKLQGDKVRVIYLPAKDQVSVTNLQALLPLYEAAAARMLSDVKRAFEDKAAEVRSKADAETAHKSALAAKDAERTTLQNTFDQTRRSLDEQIRDLRDQIQAKEQQIQQASAELESVKAESQKQLAALQSQLGQKIAEIRTLVSREQPFVNEGTDGTVVGAGAGIAIIDLGKKNMLMAGTKFTVLGRVKGGDLVPKGTLEVVSCKDESAECRVLSDSPSNPIGAGDLIQSPTYSPNRTMRFCMIGDFRKMGRTQAEGRLRQLGATVDTHVSTETHYLVLGGIENVEENEEYKRAKEFGVTVITEAQLASFTMY